jgi:hypothetical protein
MIGEEPSPHFYSKVFAKYKTVVEEGLLTPTQRNLQAQQLLDINMSFGREVFPPSMIVKDMNIQGKSEAINYLKQQEQQAAQIQQAQTDVQHAFEHAKLQELMTKAANNIASAKERYGRFESNIGLLEERMAEVSKNRALSTKAKMESLEKMIDVIAKFGEIETALKMNEINNMDYQQQAVEESDIQRAHKDANEDEFLAKLMGGMGQNPQQSSQQNVDTMI